MGYVTPQFQKFDDRRENTREHDISVIVYTEGMSGKKMIK